MSARKRNEYLEGYESEDDNANGYDSEAVEDSRTGHGSKRRRVEADSSDEETLHDGGGVVVVKESRHLGTTDKNPQESQPAEQMGATSIDRLPPSLPKSVLGAQKAAQKSGVIYLSRIPPFMKAQTLRHFLTPHARKGLGRIFLTPETAESHVRRVRNGGNKKKSFADGWVEFTSKGDAKAAVGMLNGNIMGGKKGGYYHDDLWTMRYLKGFKWSDLQEQMRNEDAERAARLREEVRRTRVENRRFMEDWERGKMEENMRQKKRARGAAEGDTDGQTRKRRRSEFKQQKVHQVTDEGEGSAQVERLRGKIFG